MYRAALRSSPRALRTIQQSSTGAAGRRFASTFPADRRGTWKGAALRWGLAGAAVYWYNTSPVFAEEAEPRNIPPPPQFSDDDLPTVNAVIEQKRKEAGLPALNAVPEAKPESSDGTAALSPEGTPAPGSAEALQAEADQQGAYNPETGEINWDCSCLGGMAHGPCGEEFKAAFSCFVYSSEEPKGMDCIEKFQGMQDCFRKYPEIYGAELEDEDSDSTSAGAIEGASASDAAPENPESSGAAQPKKAEISTPSSVEDGLDREPSNESSATTSEKKPEDAETIIPKAAFDTTDANKGQ